MAEILVKAVDATHSDPGEDARGCFKRGDPVVVMPDGHPWGADEGLPKFVVLRLPLVSQSRVLEYLQEQTVVVDLGGGELGLERLRRRLWRIRWADLPAAARAKLAAGSLTIKAVAAYDGPFDLTWTQVRTFLRNASTGTDETRELE